MPRSYVFISYSRQDRPFVERLASGLRDAGVQTWTDLENIKPGEDWAQTIDQGLRHAGALIYVASRHSAESSWMRAEVAAFRDRDQPVIPVVLDDDGVEHLPQQLQRVQWADFRTAFEPALRQLLDGLREFRSASPVAAPEAKSKGYLFLSYADEDSGFVGELKSFLKGKGYAYWDFHDSERNYQVDYTLELEGVIRNAAGTLSVVSPDWKRSPTAFQELHFSREIGTPVFLLKVRDPGPTLAIAGITHIDFLGQRREGFARLDGEMRRKGL